MKPSTRDTLETVGFVSLLVAIPVVFFGWLILVLELGLRSAR